MRPLKCMCPIEKNDHMRSTHLRVGSHYGPKPNKPPNEEFVLDSRSLHYGSGPRYENWSDANVTSLFSQFLVVSNREIILTVWETNLHVHIQSWVWQWCPSRDILVNIFTTPTMKEDGNNDGYVDLVLYFIFAFLINT